MALENIEVTDSNYPEVVKAVIDEVKSLGDNTKKIHEDLNKSFDNFKKEVDLGSGDYVKKEKIDKLTEDITKLGQSGFVFYSTIRSFKGLEARHVVFVDADKPDLKKSLSKEDLYVALKDAEGKCCL